MVKTEEKRVRMSRLIALWRGSKESKRTFCRSEGINIHTFNYWIAKLESDKESDKELEWQPQGFVCLRPAEVGLCLRFPSGATLRVCSQVSVEEIAVLKSLLY